MKRLISIIIALFSLSILCGAQNCVVKTNTLYWATTTPNLGVEFSVAPRWTIDLQGGYNPWTLDNETNAKLKHFLVSPEVRYWFCESFFGHFVGLDVNYTMFNMGAIPFIPQLKDTRVEGWAAGAGLVYGCSWPIARRWNIEANIGAGLWYSEYDRYESRKCGLFDDSVSRLSFGLTSLGVSFVYIIK